MLIKLRTIQIAETEKIANFHSGRTEEAKQTLAKLHANGDINDELVAFELEDIMTSIKQEHSSSNPIKELFTKSYYFRPLLLSVKMIV